MFGQRQFIWISLFCVHYLDLIKFAMRITILLILSYFVISSTYGQQTETSLDYGFFQIDQTNNFASGHLIGLNMNYKINNRLGFGIALQNWVSYGKRESTSETQSLNNQGLVNTRTHKYSYRNSYKSLDLLSSYTFLSANKLSIDAGLGYGFIKIGSIYGKALASVTPKMHITNNISIGIPLTYGYIFWLRDSYYTAGVRVGYRL